MKGNKILTLMAAAMTMTACSVSDITGDIYGNNVTVESATVTRATDNTAEDITEDFRLVNMTQKENAGSRCEAIFSYDETNGCWTTSDDIVWYDGIENEFQAVIPTTARYNSHNLPTDQSDADKLKAADWQKATCTLSHDDATDGIALNFEHQYAKLNFDVILKNDYATAANITAVTILDKITSYIKEDNTIEAIIPPTEPTPSLIKLEINGETLIAYPPQSITAFEKGKQYNFTLAIGHNAATISGVTVSDWTPIKLADGMANKIPYVTFSADAEQVFSMSVSSERYTLPNLEYSVGNGIWDKVVENTEVKFGGNLGALRLRGKSLNGTAESNNKYSTITFTNTNVPVTCTGDIRTLVDYNNYMTVDTQNARFCNLFKYCTVLETAPELPATTLADNCYYMMFYECKSLKKAPALPATELVDNCYYMMFSGCSALTDAPALPATTLVDYCYESMFNGCTSLKNAPQELPAMKLEDKCYESMFSGCTSLEKAPALPATTLVDYCYNSMFNGCTSLTNAPELNAKELASSCYDSMFDGCKSLKKAPALPATTLADYCYNSMFAGCTSLTKAPALPATTLADYCYNSMFAGCTSLTKAPELNATTLASGCYGSMFDGCESLEKAPALPATTLANYCYNSMFNGCTSLTNAPELNATTLASGCYYSMFYGCTKLTTAPVLPATTLASGCYYYMFYKCTRMTEAPELPATTLASECYKRMFGVCTSLESVTMLAPADQITNNPSGVTEWLDNAGTSDSPRTLKLSSKDAYNNMIDNNYLPDKWRIGQATVLDKDGNEITE